MGDGNEVTFEIYAAKVIWDGEYHDIPVNEAELDSDKFFHPNGLRESPGVAL
ncbi:hypothetical protein [Synechococcus sp. PCC 7336]|uniref:hypothetical protein n=1 Tax=Synechococcus sp. PCC 7336 TaxID=195250 RepID=UPI00034BDCCB|nr:hypothetical protein [Synechococcus sp. PCC 7336]